MPLLQHLNSVDKNVQFTSEEPGPEGALPFLDILIKPDQEGRLHTTVYRKPTHRPVPSLGQSTSYIIKVVVPPSQNQNHLLRPPAVKRRRSSNQGSDEMQLPQVGTEQSENEDEQHSPQKQKQGRTHSKTTPLYLT